MYREHFGLKLKPFSITPDPKFLYMSPGHKEALAHLLYGLKEGSGFVVITGEVGTGKTTILNAFLLKLPPRIPKVVIKNPHINPENLYFLLGEAIGMPEDKRSRSHINDFEDRLKKTGGAVLIVDESQGLSFDMLEEIRLLSNLETVHEKLVQIMLLGQQELNEKLNSSQLRQLKQRIGVKYHIPPLDSNETKDYIDHRLRVAGHEPSEEPLFTSSALGEIYRYTRGFPRLINIVCDNVLLAAYSDDLKQISASLVKKVVGGMEKTYARHESQIPVHHIQREKGGRGLWIGLGIAAGAIIIFAAALGFILSPLGQGILFSAKDTFDSPGRVSSTSSALAQGSLSDSGKDPSGDNAARELPNAPLEDQAGLAAGSPSENDKDKKTIGITTVVGSGDTVAKIAARHYGRVDPGILDLIRKSNGNLGNMDLIFEGQKIYLPPVADTRRVLFTVSVASYQSINDATAVFLDLVRKGFKPTIYPFIDSRGNTWYRVTMGAFQDKNEAEVYLRQLKTRGFTYAKTVKVSLEG